MNRSVSISIFNKTFSIKVFYILLFLMVIAAIVRLYRLNYVSLWLDELYSMIGSDPNATFFEVYEYSRIDQPPVFFILLNYWLKLFGYHDFAGRALSSVFGVLGVIAIFYMGKEIKDERLGLFAAFITAINWFHADISREIRFYPLVFLFSTLSYFFYLRSIKKTHIIDFCLYAVFTSLLLNTHYFGMVVFASQLLIFLFILIFFKRSVRLVIGSLVAGTLAGLSLWHWLPVIQLDLQIEKFFIGPVTFDLPFSLAWGYINEPITFGLFIVLFFLVIKKFYENIKARKITIEHVVMFGWIFFGFMIPLIYSLLKIPLLTGKYCTIIVPAIFLVIANGLSYIKNQKIITISIFIITISSVINLFIVRANYKPKRAEDWREVALYFANHNLNNELVFSQLAWFHQYYFNKFGLTLPKDQNSADFTKFIKNNKRIWLLLNEQYDWEQKGFLKDQQQIIRNEFDLKDIIKFKKTKAFLYVRK